MHLKINRVVPNWQYADKVVPDLSNAIPNGHGRRFSKSSSMAYWKEAFLEFGLVPDCLEPIYENFTGNHFLNGAFVNPHKDPSPDGYYHVRCNLMIKKPLEGGNPVLDGEEVEVKEKDLWLCIASLEEHCSTPIAGGERLVYSFGGLVPKQQIDNILANEGK